MENLTEKVLQYQRTRRGLTEIVEDLAQRIYQFPRRKMGWDEDACGDFYLFFHPRLLRLLDRFQDQGKPFESYLCAVLTWQLRNFARDRRRADRSWGMALRLEPGPASAPAVDDSLDEATAEPEAGTPKGSPPQASASQAGVLPAGLPPGLWSEFAPLIRSSADRRNLLFLILKCARNLQPEHVGPLARLAGVDPARIAELSEHLCRLRAPRDTRLETLRLRRNKAYSQCRLLEAELLHETDPARRDNLSRRLARITKRMRLAMARMARVGLAPTNREIAAALDVPKGTVDSGLFWLKRKLAVVYDPHGFRSA